jgi:hypothetical protein
MFDNPYICIIFIFILFFILWIFWEHLDAPSAPSDNQKFDKIIYNDISNDPISKIDIPTNPITGSEAPINSSNPSQPQIIEISSTPLIAPAVKPARFTSRGERICRETMEKFYGVPFVSTWPKWLINPETGRNLELDCYNEDLKLAVEYNGEQHYKWPNYTNQTEEQFINQIRRDMLKQELCEHFGVYLIIVPYSIPHNEIPLYIKNRLPESTISINKV